MNDSPSTEELRRLLNRCRHHTAHLKEDPEYRNYFQGDDFDKAVDDFFGISDEDLLELYNLPYPIYGRLFFNQSIIKNIVQEIPELFLSILQYGNSKLLTLYGYQSDQVNNHIPFTHENIRKISEKIFDTWLQIGDIETSNLGEEEKLLRLSQLTETIEVSNYHYDILGTFQLNISSQLYYLQFRGVKLLGNHNFLMHPNSRKRELLTQVTGYLALPIKLMSELEATDDNLLRRDEILLHRLEDDQYIQNVYSGLHEGLNLPAPTSESLASNFIEESIPIDSTLIDTLQLHLPEDQTTDQSPVYLDFMTSDKKIADINLSHMEAAFLFYIGAERQADESYWLHEPEKHKPLLKKIWNSFALPKHFETELEMTSPTKGSTSTWIWDFRNVNRKTWRNQIHRKIKVLRLDALDFKLITSIKPKSPSRGGNYKLNNQIKSFEIIQPSK